MKFSEFSKYLFKIEKTSSRLEITDILSELLKNLSENEIRQAVNLMLGILGPAYENKVFNVAEKMNISSIAIAFEQETSTIKTSYKQAGDLGLVAEALSENKNCDLTVNEIYEDLLNLANFEGEGSVEAKITALSEVYKSLDKLSLRFVARIPVGKLRLGFSEKTIIDALSKAFELNKKEIGQAFEVVPDIAVLSEEIKHKGAKALKYISPKVGIPVMPALAARLNSPDEMIEKMIEVSVEPKFDGLRTFIHFQRGKEVLAFSRNMNRIEKSFPELQEVGKYINADEAIIDSEAIGVDPETEKFLDFQKTISRRRKHNVVASQKEIPLTFQVFDILLFNNTNLMNDTYLTRRSILEKLFKNNNIFKIDEKTITKDPEVIRNKHKEYLKKGLEGVIVKKTDSKYISGRTGWRWVKMKEVENTRGKLSDTIDAVIMGYTQGKGKRAGFGIGQFLAGVKSGEKFLTITKVGTGLTDEQFRELYKKLKGITVKDKPHEYEVTKELTPDFWVEPKVVVEIAADEITVSPPNKHTAGFALRFPRLIKFRNDKSALQATTLDELKSI